MTDQVIAVGMAKFDIESVEPQGGGQVKFMVAVKRAVVSEDANVSYVAIGSAHRHVVLDAAVVNGVLAKDWTDDAKKSELEGLIRVEVKSWGIVESEAAVRGVAALYPEFPQQCAVELTSVAVKEL